MINLNVIAKEKKIVEACNAFKAIIQDPLLFEFLKKQPHNWPSKVTSKNFNLDVWEDLVRKSNLVVNVKSYWGPRGVYGYFIASRPKDININRRKLNRSIASIVATIAHESLGHMLDATTADYNFGHSHKNPERDSFPYWLGEQVFEYMTGKKSAPIIADMQFLQLQDAYDYAEIIV